MVYNPKIHHRRSIRLKGYDYSQVGAYFITICTHNRECVFGEVVEGEMRLNEIGIIVQEEWLNTPTIRSSVELDVFVVMPNHFHGIIKLNDDDGGASQRTNIGGGESQSENPRKGELQFAPTGFSSPSRTVGAIVRGFKSASTKRINALRRTPGVLVWQRNYYDRTVRNQKEMNRIQEYIVNNPLQWFYDEENPESVSG